MWITGAAEETRFVLERSAKAKLADGKREGLRLFCSEEITNGRPHDNPLIIQTNW
jgi:hypothetical protein